MRLIDHINLYFGTEHSNIKGFVKDISSGELDGDYDDDSEKLSQLLMFLHSYERALEINKEY